jgi:hypothetical protein
MVIDNRCVNIWIRFTHTHFEEKYTFQSSGKITVKRCLWCSQILQYGLHLYCLKETIGILWKAFEGILNDRAENPALQHSSF